MIHTLRKKFIIISVLTVAAVMVLLFAAVNIANYVSVDTKLNNTLQMIADNRGKMPRYRQEDAPDDERRQPGENGEKNGIADQRRFDKDFNEETPFSTRFFVLHYDAGGQLIDADLSQIAAVTDAQTGDYVALACAHGEGRGYTDGYKYLITVQEDGTYMAVFLNDEREISSALTLFAVSLCATLACIALISVIIILFSKKAMQPFIENEQKQKRFITDAGHELKTPITVIKTSLSVLEMEVGKQKWIDKASAQCDKLKELVNSLVTLSRLDEGTFATQMKDFCVSDALKETVDSFEEYAASEGHALVTDIPPDILYHGDEYAVRQLCSVLLDNAVKYASPNAAIHFTLKKAKKGIVIIEENESEHINPAKLDALFERFYRADESHNAQTGGFGIGLSIAHSVCREHKGNIRAESADGKTIKFTAKLK